MIKLLISALSVITTQAISFEEFGAIPSNTTTAVAHINADALMSCLNGRNSTNDSDCEVPHGNWTLYPVYAANMTNVTLTINGNVIASADYLNWPHTGGEGRHAKYFDMFNFTDSTNFTIRGKGTVDGQGHAWWTRELLNKNPHKRGRLCGLQRMRNFEMSGVTWLNSMGFNIKITDSDQVYFHDFVIMVDVWGQWAIDKYLNFNAPMFPFNTDGIDPSGTNILIERVDITNWDDAVAIKPGNKKGKIATCAENIIARDINVKYGVGASIGSVPATDNYNCVRNVTFSNWTFDTPMKAIYIKTDPGTTKSMLPGSGGEITNITYENIKIRNPVWWGIYIGPQQMKEPDGRGPGCMLYPLSACETQPLITISDITLRNITSEGGILTPGIVRCHETNPCKNINFENVNIKGWWSSWGGNFITENVQGNVTNSLPVPNFNSTHTEAIFSDSGDLSHLIDSTFNTVANLFI